MPDTERCTRLKLAVAAAIIAVCISVGWFVFPPLMELLGFSSTFTCHCIGGLIGLVAGIVVLREAVF
jgi:hypothetical protein